MTQAFADKYQAARFDESDPNEALAERARKAVLTAYDAAMRREDKGGSKQLEYLMGGLLVGVVQVVQSSADAPQDQVDAAIRASILQQAAWAVDTSRAMMGLDPLSDQN